MRSTVPMRIAKIGYMAISGLLCAMGVLLIVFPELSVRTICVAFGIMMLVFGSIKLVGYFSKDLFRLAFENDLASGILMLALGGSLLLHTDNTLTFFCTVLGILVLTDSLFKIQIAMEARPFGIKKWWLVFVIAIVTGVFGFVLVFRPIESLKIMTELLGISLIWEGALNLLTMLIMVKIIRQQHPDSFEREGK